MFLSIVIPIYNDEKYLAECLDSCLHQDIPYDDYEIICVDDESTDSTPEILKNYESQYSNIRVIFKQHGKPHGRNVGFEKATGDYVWFVDHDDLIKENCLAYLKACIEKSRCERLVFPPYKFSEALSSEEKKKLNAGEIPTNAAILMDSTAWCSIISRKFMNENHILPVSKRFSEKGGWSGDTFMIYELQKAKIKEHHLNCAPIYFWRLNQGSETARANASGSLRQMHGLLNTTSLIMEDYQEELKTSGEVSDWLTNVLFSWLRACSVSIASVPYPVFCEGRKELRNSGLFPRKVPANASYKVKDCIKLDNGKGFFESIAYYYSTTEWGLIALRLVNSKVLLARFLRKNRIGNMILDYRKRR